QMSWTHGHLHHTFKYRSIFGYFSEKALKLATVHMECIWVKAPHLVWVMVFLMLVSGVLKTEVTIVK
ncbi:hypothetical protein ACJX0J_028169, partial [Zea mays]